MSPLRMRMIEDMKLAGPGTQATYIDAVRKLAAHGVNKARFRLCSVGVAKEIDGGTKGLSCQGRAM